MNPQKVRRDKAGKLEDLPNIGKAMAADLRLIGINTPEQLRECDACELYVMLCDKTGQRQDPRVIDVFLSTAHVMRGGKAMPWREFTAERKKHWHTVEKRLGAGKAPNSPLSHWERAREREQLVELPLSPTLSRLRERG